MHVSDEQMRVVVALGSRMVSWEPVELPSGPQAVPAWARDLRVDLVPQYEVSPPRWLLKADRNLRDWPDKRFTREGDRFLAVSEDGRAECYYQAGPLSPVTLKRFRTGDGKLHAYRPQSGKRVEEFGTDGRLIASYVPADPGEWIEVERLATRQEDGFAGAHIDIILVDGTEVTLRGPWHGACPPGMVEGAYTESPSPYGWRGRRPWHDTGGISLMLTEEVFLPIVARYAPHLRLARVDEGYGPRLQVMLQEWGEPKAFYARRQRAEGVTNA